MTGRNTIPNSSENPRAGRSARRCRFVSTGIFLSLILSLGLGSQSAAQGSAEEYGNDYGIKPDSVALRIIIQAHVRWLEDADSGTRAELCRMDLRGVVLEGADLRKAKLEEADLSGARLSGANLRNAHMHRTNLAGADLTNADLRAAVMRKTNLDGADLSGANLEDANLRKSTAIGARLVGTKLPDSNLSKVDFSRASLINADLNGALLRKSIFRQADLRNANADRAKLRQADLSGANLVGASFLETDFSGAVLTGANVDHAQLGAAQGITSEQLASTVQMSGNVFAEQNASEPEVEVVGVTAEPEVVVVGGAAKAETAAETAMLIDGAFAVQLRSFRVEATAHNVWRELQNAHPGLFDGYSARIVSVALASGNWHRLQIGPLASKRASSELCTQYHKSRAEAPCIPVIAGS